MTAAPSLITVQVGGRDQAVPAGCSLAQLLDQLGQAPEAVATAVNGEFIARALRAGYRLQPGDQVQCFKPIVGG